MSEETESAANIAYNSVLRKRSELWSMIDEYKYFIDQMFDMRESLHVKYAVFRNLPNEINEELNLMVENKDLLEFNEERSNSTYDNIKTSYDTKVQEQTMYIEAQKADTASKYEELKNFQKERDVLDDEMNQKKQIISGLHDKLLHETDLVEEQRARFHELTSTSESKVKNSQFVKMQNQLQNESSELNEVINAKKEKNINICKANTAISEELAASEAQCRYKSLDVDKLHCKENFNDTTYEHAEAKNHKIMRKIEAIQQKQENEFVELEKHFAKHQEINENLKKQYNELNAQIISDLGNFESLQAKLLQSETDLARLNAECDELNDVLNEESNLKTENEHKLKKFQAIEARLMAQIKMIDEHEKQSLKKQLSQNQDLKQPELLKMDGLRTDGGEHVFSQPVTTPRKVQALRRSKKKRQSPRAIDKLIVQRADSSVSEFWDNASGEVDEPDEQRHLQTLKIFRECMG